MNKCEVLKEIAREMERRIESDQQERKLSTRQQGERSAMSGYLTGRIDAELGTLAYVQQIIFEEC